MKNKKNIKKHGNVVLFPGTTERLLDEARELAGNYHFVKANELFDKVFKITPGDETSLSVYAYSLYETKNFEKAKEVCEELLALGPSMYFEVMELYLTICMQLKQYKQVEKIIASLFEEDIIPLDQVEKFHRLQKLNADIAGNQNAQPEQPVEGNSFDEMFELDGTAFIQKSLQEQLVIVHELEGKNIRPMLAELKWIVEHEGVHPFIQSLLLIVLVEQDVSEPLTISKLNRTENVNPAQLELPTKMPQFQKVYQHVLNRLEQEPSTLELVESLIAKHAIVTYPFEWLDYDSEDVANSYINFVKTMFGEIPEMDDELIDFIQGLDTLMNLTDI
ncbi:tetratricopeptide repeat protein [Solibacillus sp. FSL K6-1523]|uniref:tetratricopeptide repeat protein n=1 Tax=Solibacillus sp. FSL K6-1523 TaxID=2921471 RepID=UPI0030F5919B